MSKREKEELWSQGVLGILGFLIAYTKIPMPLITKPMPNRIHAYDWFMNALVVASAYVLVAFASIMAASASIIAASACLKDAVVSAKAASACVLAASA